jgi:hypothetical protein
VGLKVAQPPVHSPRADRGPAGTAGPSRARLWEPELIAAAGAKAVLPVPAVVQRLQRLAGNRAVAELLLTKRAAPAAGKTPAGPHVAGTATVQRSASSGSDREFDDSVPVGALPAQGVEGQEEEFPAPGQSVQRLTIGPSGSGGTPEVTIQRVARWRAGPVRRRNNLAEAVVNGTPAGVTWPTLNGTQFWSAAEAAAAIQAPTLSFSAAAAGGVDARVTTVPTNTGSFDETVLRPGPWRMAAPQATIAAMLPALTTCTGAGNTTFRAYGSPSDQAMFRANRRHEDRHATDHRDAFNGSVRPWDARLTAARAAGTTYNGPDQASAEAALYAAMGGTPTQVATAFMDACAAAVVAYHASPEGGPIGAPTNPSAAPNCSWSRAHYTNPS